MLRTTLPLPRWGRCCVHGRLVLLAAILAAPRPCEAQYHDNSAPVAAFGTLSGVRGLRDYAPHAGAMPTGAGGAPAATFDPPQRSYDLIAPGSTPTPDDLLAPPPQGAPAPAAETTPVPIEGAEIVARVDGQVILASDVLWQVKQLIKMAKTPIPPEHVAEAERMLMRTLVMGLIDTKLLYSDFRRTVPAENLPKVEESLAKPFEDVEIPRLLSMLKLENRGELEAALATSGTSLREVQRQFNEKTIAGEWLRQIIPKPQPITYEELLAYYQDHLKEYEFPAQARWEELMVRFDRCGGDRAEAWRQLCAMGNEVWQAAAANPVAAVDPNVREPVFAAIAKERSHGVTATNGGVYDWTTLGALRCEGMNEALADLQIGQMSDGIESDSGFCIVRVLERKQAGRVPFTEAQAAIRTLLEKEQRTALLEKELKKLRAAARAWTIFDGEMNGAELSALLQESQRR